MEQEWVHRRTLLFRIEQTQEHNLKHIPLLVNKIFANKAPFFLLPLNPLKTHDSYARVRDRNAQTAPELFFSRILLCQFSLKSFGQVYIIKRNFLWWSSYDYMYMLVFWLSLCLTTTIRPVSYTPILVQIIIFWKVSKNSCRPIVPTLGRLIVCVTYRPFRNRARFTGDGKGPPFEKLYIGIVSE